MLIDKTRELWERDELPDELAWIDRLSKRHQRLFFAEVQFQWGRYCATHDADALSVFLDDWNATAEADASPEHSVFLLSPKREADYDDLGAAG